MANASSSESAFKSFVDELQLTPLFPKMKEHGWVTFGDFSFATGDPDGKDAALFDKDVVQVLLPADGTMKNLLPRLRRLYAQSYIVSSQNMADFANPQGVTEKAHMLLSDRAARTEALRAKITGFDVAGPNLPSIQLIDTCTTILTKGHMKHIPWEKCTSRDDEAVDDPIVRGLRITSEGLLMQDVTPDLNTDVSGQFLWDYAVRRRALAAEIAGLCDYTPMNRWHETLKSHLLMPPPAGHKKVTWQQLLNADKALWQMVARECENGCKADHADPKGETAFEKAFRKAAFDPDVRAHLHFLQGDSPANGPDLARLQNRIQNLEQQLAGQKRKHNEIQDKGKGKGKKGDKGKGKGKHRRGANNQSSKPAAFGDLPSKTPSGENLCFNFNLPVGCPHAQPGEKCHRGWHMCPRCDKPHSLNGCRARHQ